GVVPDRVLVEVGRGSDAALGNEAEAAVHVREQAGQVEVGAEDLGVFELEAGGVGAVVALVPRGLLRTRRAGVAAVDGLVVLQDAAGRRVAAGDLDVDLAVVGRQLGHVGGAADGHDVDLLVAVRTPHPQAIAHDRAADLTAEVLDAVDQVASGDTGLA